MLAEVVAEGDSALVFTQYAVMGKLLAVFFSSLLPPFVPAGAAPLPAMLALGAVFVAMTVVWLSGYAVVIARLGDSPRAAPPAAHVAEASRALRTA